MATGNAITLQVHGMSDLERALRELPDKIGSKVLTAALMDGAAVIRREARAKVPIGTKPHYIGKKAKGKRVMPGNLRKLIRARRVKESKHSAAVAVSWTGDAFYGRFLEFGTAKMPAQPFLRPAFDNTKERALERIKQRLAERIEKEAAKLAREANHAHR